MKNLWILLLFLYCISALDAQSILTEDVITAGGGHYKLNKETVDWTLGDWMIESYPAAPYLESGFLHAESTGEILTPNYTAKYDIQAVHLWPNPARSYFYIDVTRTVFDRVEFRNPQGQLIQRWEPNHNSKYAINTIGEGNYFVLLINKGEVVHFSQISIIY